MVMTGRRPGPVAGLAAAAAALAAAAVLAAAEPAPAHGERLHGQVATLGRSVEGRPIRVVRIGDRRAPRKVLVVGAIHGNETAGIPVVRALRRRDAPRGVELWLIPSLNPDGVAAGTRQNARGVDLNRNFSNAWRAQGRPFDVYYAGPRPLSEPESRLASRLIARLRPSVTIWFHQAMALVDLGTANDPRLVRRYARLSGLPARRLGFLPGVATRWQNARDRGSSAFVVELPAGRLDAAAVARHAAAVRAVARVPR
jgi:protein MpaA